MHALKANVRKGHLVVEQAIDLPEGTELELTIADPGDDLDDSERAELHAALSKAWDTARLGKGHPATALLSKLRSRK